jgi:hypothetical protein
VGTRASLYSRLVPKRLQGHEVKQLNQPSGFKSRPIHCLSRVAVGCVCDPWESEMKTLSDLIDEGIHVRREAVRVIVTPACAARAMKLNIGNRYPRRSNVEYLALVISTGDWRDDHPQGLSFSDTGKLIDGQHRLMAVQKAGRPVIARVDTGCDQILKQHLDIGVSRNVADRTEFSEDKRVNKRLTEIVRALCVVKCGDAKKMPISFYEAVYSCWKTEVDVVAQYYLQNKHRTTTKGLLRTGTCAAYVEAVRKDKEWAIRFIDSVSFPDGELQQGRALREWLIRNPALSGKHAIIQDYRISWAAMEASLAGKEVKVLRPLSRDIETIGYPLKGGE